MVGMAKTYRPWNVDQCMLLPPSVQELVPAVDEMAPQNGNLLLRCVVFSLLAAHCVPSVCSSY